jgi:hypothetical protein
MQKYRIGSKVRVLKQRAGPDKQLEIGFIKYAAQMTLVSDVPGKDMLPTVWVYLVQIVENCPPGLPDEQRLREDELEPLVED